jgi:CDP-diacylglycerol---serine O-phosphatidyltransferase
MKRAGSGFSSGYLTRNIPNAVTVLSLCSGLTSLRMTLMDRLEPAIYLILIAIVLDGLDGRVARFLNAESRFGAELDSFSDFLCFGIAPGLLLYRFMFDGTDQMGIGWAVVLFLVVCCMLRLARFNVASSEPENSGSSAFVGVPAPALAFLSLLPIYLKQSGFTPTDFFQDIFLVYLVGVGLLAISTIPTYSPKMFKMKSANARVVSFIGAVFLVLILSFSWYSFALLALLYLFSIPLLAFRYR